MKYVWIIVLAAVLAAGLTACKHTADVAEDEEPLLLLDDEPLLLLDEAPAQDGAPMADNQACFVCHGNFVDEEFSVTHAQANVGCADCHGVSYEHTDDEDNVTPPDTMYAKDQVNPLCLECHAREDLDKNAHAPLFAGKAPEGERYCTDCHGEHRMFLRARRWDKQTGELLQ